MDAGILNNIPRDTEKKISIVNLLIKDYVTHAIIYSWCDGKKIIQKNIL